jgi:hypothetical protein
MTTADNMTVTATATEYTVSAVPETHRDHHLSAITVAYRFADAWTVSRHVAGPEIGASLRRVLDEAKPEGGVAS